MVIENILREEILGVNKKIVKKRENLKKLLKEPVIEDENNKIFLNAICLKEIEKKCNLPVESIFLPITFFIPSGLSEGYVIDERDSRVVEVFIENIQKRNGKFWIEKYRIRELVNKYRGCFQIIILP